jgi:hypothetical protein
MNIFFIRVMTYHKSRKIQEKITDEIRKAGNILPHITDINYNWENAENVKVVSPITL